MLSIQSNWKSENVYKRYKFDGIEENPETVDIATVYDV